MTYDELKIKLQEFPDGYCGIVFYERGAIGQHEIEGLTHMTFGDKKIHVAMVECRDIKRIKVEPLEYNDI
jgi:hypothetical protein